MLKLFKPAMGIAVGLLLLMSSAAQAAISPASVLAINTDTSNSKLYVEISYVGRPCLIYQLKFGVGIFDAAGNATVPGISDDTLTARPFKVVTGAGDAVVWRIDEDDDTNPTHNNPMPANGYITKVNGDVAGDNDTLMYDMQISGYRLEFDLAALNNGSRVLPTDSIKVCLRSQMKPIKCVGCGTAGTDRMFSLNDIAAGCPYDYDNREDMVACYQRDSKVANWEGWFVDARDCQRYRTVQMPDGKWWMAQNLNFQGTDGNKMTFKSDYKYLNDAVSPTTLDHHNGLFWCPDSAVNIIVDSLSPASFKDSAFYSRKGSKAACDTYGAFYSAVTILIKDGKTTGALQSGASDFMPATVFGDTLTHRQGICPEGWWIPSQNQWGKMINLVEKNCEDTSKHYFCTTTGDDALDTNTYVLLPGGVHYQYNPCKHMGVADGHRWNASVCAYKDLLSTNVAPYRALDTTPSYGFDVIGNSGPWGFFFNRRSKNKAPKKVTRYATQANPVWSYYEPETAGTDKYGFSILPAGLRMYNTNASFLLGENAAFWTSSSVNAGTPAVTGDYLLMRSFSFNTLLNAVMPHGIFSAKTVNSTFGFSLRCVADSK